MHILALDQRGVPREWINLEQAITYHAKEQVAWSLGSVVATFRGGVRRIDGQVSELSTPSIISIKNHSAYIRKPKPVALTNKSLFARDQHLCAYCGKVHTHNDCSREHIIPVSRGGNDVWTNVVTACKRCNHKKAARTPEEAKMQLIYVPYEPNQYEYLILQNRNILVDQMEYLLAGVSNNSRLLL